MKKIDLGQTVNTLANVGVIAGIVFLGLELQQDRNLTRVQIRHELSQGAIDFLAREATDASLANIVRRSSDGEELTPDERHRFDRHILSWFRYIEDAHYQYRNGLYDEEEFIAQKETWRVVLRNPAVRERFCSLGGYSAEFLSDIETLLTDPCPL